MKEGGVHILLFPPCKKEPLDTLDAPSNTKDTHYNHNLHPWLELVVVGKGGGGYIFFHLTQVKRAT